MVYVYLGWCHSDVLCNWALGIVFVVTVVSPGDDAMIQSTSKQRRVDKGGTVLQRSDFQLETSDDEAVPDVSVPCTPQQAARLGEIVASELESRTVEHFVAREYCYIRVVSIASFVLFIRFVSSWFEGESR